MTNPSGDRNLLVGILALQLDLVTSRQLMEAMHEWVLRKSERIEDILLRLDAINAEKREFLQGLAAKHVELHDNDVEQSLAALSSLGSMRKTLADLEDDQIEQTLCVVDALKQQGSDLSKFADLTGTAEGGDPNLGNDRFRILRLHARGGLGQVSVAEDTELHREVALKEIQDRYADDQGSRLRFQVEAEVTGRLEHPGIVPVYSLGNTRQGRPFYVMRFIRGDSLKDAVERFHSPKMQLESSETRHQILRKLVQRLIDVCNAIEYAHSRGVLHRDLKPGNVMLGKYGETLVVDWGLAKSVGKSGDHAASEEGTFVPQSTEGSTETRMGTVVGTPAYMSPEQADGRLSDLGPHSDVYCLGATLYCVLTGERPVPAATQSEMLDTIRTGAIRPPRQLNARIDPALDAICRKAMAIKPADRYATAAALAEDMELWLADLPVSAFREPLSKRAARFVRRHRTSAMVSISVLAVSAVSLAVIAGLVGSKNRQLTAANAEIRSQSKEIQDAKIEVEESRDAFRLLAFDILDSAEQRLQSSPGVEAFRNQLLEKSFNTLARLHEQAPADVRVQRALAESARLSANQKARTDDSPGAVARMQLSVELQKDGLATADDPFWATVHLAETYRDLAGIQRRNAQLNAAADALSSASELLNGLEETEESRVPLLRLSASVSLAQIGCHDELFQLDEALDAATRSVDQYLAVLESGESTAIDLITTPLAIAWKGRILDDLERHEEARVVFAEGIALARKNQLSKPTDRNFLYGLSRLLHWDADGQSRSGISSPELTAQIDEAAEISGKLHTDYELSEGFQYNYGDALRTHGHIKAAENDAEAATASFDQAVSVLESLVAKSPLPDYLGILATTLADRAEFTVSRNREPAAIADLQAALALTEKCILEAPDSVRLARLKTRIEDQLRSLPAPE